MKDSIFIKLIIGVVLIGVAIFVVFRHGGETDKDIRTVAPVPEEEKKDNNTTMISGDNFSGPVVRYTGAEFVPQEILLTPENGGCLVTVLNEDRQDLTVRLGPHNLEGNDPGFSYDSVPPGEAQIIDPRYRIDEISFHNHARPGPDFSVTLDSLCLP
jgi:hypothetical protein